MLAVVSAEGYSGASIAHVIARAGVSRATFYEYFPDKDACFLALYRDISKQLLDRIGTAISNSPPERALHTVIRQLTEHAETEPAQAQFLASDALAAGPRALAQRERTITAIGRTIKTAYSLASPQRRSPDLPAQTVIGSTYWLISQRIRRAERDLTKLSRELTDWLTPYEQPIGKHRWSTLNPGPPPERPLRHSDPPDEPPRTVPGEGSRTLASDLARNRRWRILYATGETAVQTGYAAATVTAIITRARLNRQTFYNMFRDKRQAFLVLHELASQQTMDIGAAAYFSAEPWSERVWQCLLATSEFHAAHTALAHVGFLETHALGLPAIQRVEDNRQAFGTLLRTDSQNTSPRPNATIAEAIGAAIFEIGYDRVLRQRTKELPRYAYAATYLALVPFLGVQAANRFVQGKVEDAEQ